jgi:uncharacterized protein
MVTEDAGQVSVSLAPFVRQKTVLLTTFRRDGTSVGTPVSIAVEGDRAFVRTWDTSGKMKRIRNNPEVTIAPSTTFGTPTGPALPAEAKILTGSESSHAGHLLARKYPLLHGVIVPLTHRLRRNTTTHIELTGRTRHDTGHGASAEGVSDLELLARLT